MGPNICRGCSRALVAESERNAYFLADLKTKEKAGLKFATMRCNREEVRIGRWADLGAYRVHTCG